MGEKWGEVGHRVGLVQGIGCTWVEAGSGWVTGRFKGGSRVGRLHDMWTEDG